MTRKEFIKVASASALLTTLGVTLEGCSEDEPTVVAGGGSPIEIDLSVDPFSILNTEGEWLLHPSRNVLFINDNGEIRAFTSVCTHQGCSRNWSFSNEEFICSCHSSRFDTDGHVVGGPATGSLSEFTVTRNGNILTLS